MRLPGTVFSQSYFNSVFELIRSSSIEYRPNSTSSWQPAEDIEGNILSSNSSLGGISNPIFSGGRGYAAVPYTGSFFNGADSATYGCYDFGTSNGSLKGQIQMWAGSGNPYNEVVVTSWAAIGNSPVYNDGTGFGEYRLTTNNLSGNATSCDGAPITIYQNVRYELNVGDFYYGFGNNRGFSYKINTTAYGSSSQAHGASISSINTQVYAREPIPRYVTQFYTDVNLTNKLDLGTGGPGWFAYRPSNTAAVGSSYVGNASSTTSRIMAEAAELAATSTLPNSNTKTNQDHRVWAGNFLRQGSTSSEKIKKSSVPKQG